MRRLPAMPWRASSRAATRVSSAAMTGTSPSTRNARSVRSSRLPIGEPTTKSVFRVDPRPNSSTTGHAQDRLAVVEDGGLPDHDIVAWREPARMTRRHRDPEPEGVRGAALGQYATGLIHAVHAGGAADADVADALGGQPVAAVCDVPVRAVEQEPERRYRDDSSGDRRGDDESPSRPSHRSILSPTPSTDPLYIAARGRTSRKARPYSRLEIRLSRITTAPRSDPRRIRRPNPCFKRKAASGSA